jgi:hypothetical protein
MRGKAELKIALAVLLTILVGSDSIAKIIYVDSRANGANDGSSWNNAYKYLQDAIADANSNDKPIEIRVAQGIYKPDKGANQTLGNRDATFQLIIGVALKGGYASIGAPDPVSRDVTLYKTTVSGDLKGNDDTITRPFDMEDDPYRLDNSYHVVTATGTDSTAVLDGFVVTAGYADATGGRMDGAGMLIYQANPTVTNCTFTGNWALNYGAGLCAEPNSCPIVSNCLFTANSSTDGAGVDNEYSNPTFIRCSFVGNWVWEYNADTYGGVGMYNFHSSPVLINCLFAANGAPGWGAGGAIRNNEGNPTLINCTICGNYSNGQGAGIYNGWQSNPRLVNCILWNNKNPGGGGSTAQIWGNAPSIEYCCIEGWTEQLGGTNNIALDPLFSHQGYWDPNTIPDQPWDDLPTDGDYHLKSQSGRWDPKTQIWVKDDVTSPCIDAGDPMSPIGVEPFSNGGRINMGVYGGTAEASKSYFGEPVCETIIAGDINGDCKVNFTDFEIMALHWLEVAR